MAELLVRTPVDARLDLDYLTSTERLRALYERAKGAQWNAATDVDWSIEVPFGEPLPDESDLRHGLVRGVAAGRGAGGRVGQVPVGAAVLDGQPVPARRAGRARGRRAGWWRSMPTIDASLRREPGRRRGPARRGVLPVPAGEGARGLPDRSAAGRAAVGTSSPTAGWDITALGMQMMVEALAMAAFRMANSTFHDDLIKQITRLVARDEARHVRSGCCRWRGMYAGMTPAELADREDIVLDAAEPDPAPVPARGRLGAARRAPRGGRRLRPHRPLMVATGRPSSPRW